MRDRTKKPFTVLHKLNISVLLYSNFCPLKLLSCSLIYMHILSKSRTPTKYFGWVWRFRGNLVPRFPVIIPPWSEPWAEYRDFDQAVDSNSVYGFLENLLGLERISLSRMTVRQLERKIKFHISLRVSRGSWTVSPAGPRTSRTVPRGFSNERTCREHRGQLGNDQSRSFLPGIRNLPIIRLLVKVPGCQKK